MNESNQRVFDKEAFLQRVNYDFDIVLLLQSEVFDRMPDLIDQLKAFMESNETERLRQTAHEIKGTALNMSFNRLASWAVSIENILRDGNGTTDRMGEAINSIALEWDNVIEATAPFFEYIGKNGRV
jgi:HPt (histidine-containing phosphotransfer) domain-containing protein